MKFIRRWGLMRNTEVENIQEHSLQVAMVAHGLAVIRNRFFGGEIDPQRTALLAMFHDANEVITGDLATPVKNFNPEICNAYHDIENSARKRLLAMLPAELQSEYEPLFFAREKDGEIWNLIKAADKICAYLKCVDERQAGNKGFLYAERTLRDRVDKLDLPEVQYFMAEFVPSFSLTLDELN